MALTVSTPYKTNTVASVSGTTFTSNGTPFVAGDVGRFIVFTNGAAIGQIRRIVGFTSTNIVTVDLAWDTSNVTGFTDSLPVADNTWVMSSTLDDIDDGVHIIKESASLYRQVTAAGLVTIGEGVFIADTSLAFELDTNLFKLHISAFCQFGYLAPGGYGMYGCTLIDLLTTAASGWSGPTANGNCGDLHLYGCNVSSSLTGNPFWRLYRGDGHIVRFIDCDFNGNFGGRVRGTRSVLLRCTYRGNTSASMIAGIGAVANFGLISECRVQGSNQAIYSSFDLGVGTVTSPVFDAISGRIFSVSASSNVSATYAIEDYVESQVTSAASVILSGTTFASAFISFRQWVTASIVNTSLALITDSARRVIRNGAASVVDNVTTTSGSFSRYTAEVRRFSLVTGSTAWEAGMSYGPYEQAIATYLYQTQNLSLPLATSSNVQFTMILDTCLTETDAAVVGAWTTIADPGQLYDRYKSWFVDNLDVIWPTFGTQKFTCSGDTLIASDTAVTIDSTAVSAFTPNAGANTLTLKTTDYGVGVNLIRHRSNGGSLTLAGASTVSAALTLNGATLTTPDIDRVTGAVTTLGTSQINVGGPGVYPATSVNATSKITVTSATSGDVHDARAVVFAIGSTFENNSGQPITLKLSPTQVVPTLLQTSGAITLDNSVSITISAPNIIDGSQVRLYNATAVSEIDNSPVSGGAGYSITITSGVHYTQGDALVLLAAYQVGGVAKRILRLTGTAGTNELTFTDSQVDWTGPNVLGIDGSTVTECSTDYVEIQVGINDGDDSTVKSRIAAFIVDALATEEGLRNWVALDGSSLISYTNDGASAQIDTSVATVEVINVKPMSKLVINDNFGLDWSDGMYHVDAVVGASIVWINPHAVFPIAVGSAVLPSDIVAIADAVWDEATADHTATGSTGEALNGAGGGGGATAEQVRIEMDANSTKLAAIVADTNELKANQGNWVTATGFATPTNVTDAQTAIIAQVDANEAKIDLIETKAQADARQALLIAEHDATQAALITPGALRTELATELGRIDVAVSSRNATAPDNAGVAAIKAKTDQLNFTGTDVQSVASNMRGNDNAITSLTPVLDAIAYLRGVDDRDLTEVYDHTPSVNLTPVIDAIEALHDFDPAQDTVAHVTLVDTNADNVTTDLTPVLEAITDLKGADSRDLTEVYNNVPAIDLSGVALEATAQAIKATVDLVETKDQADARQAIIVSNQSAIGVTLDTALEQATLARKHLTNRDKIDTSTKTLVRYDDDGVTAIATYDLKGATGAPDALAPFEKVPQ